MRNRSTTVAPQLDDTPSQPFLPQQWGGLVGRRRFRAMNTDVEIVAVDWRQSARLASAERLFHDFEARFSRFRPESELSLLNASAGTEHAISPQLLQLLDLAMHYQRETGGVFDPAILPDLEAAGYDRSFEFVARSGDAVPQLEPPAGASIADLSIDYKRRLVCAPRNLRIDLGGIGKGAAVDAAAITLASARDFLVNAGGDIFASGNSAERAGWPVAVSDPDDEDRDIDVVTLRDEAIRRGSRAFNLAKIVEICSKSNFPTVASKRSTNRRRRAMWRR